MTGGLYQWEEITAYMDDLSKQGLCPPEWHVPATDEWALLFAPYVNNGYAGSHLLASGNSGFNALLGGVLHDEKAWSYQSFATFFWSSTPSGINKSWGFGMNKTDPSVSNYPALRNNAFSVRCVKD